jgi:hypothetical protein
MATKNAPFRAFELGHLFTQHPLPTAKTVADVGNQK